MTSTCISAVATLIVTWALVCRKYRKPFYDGFLITRVSRRTVLVSLLIGVGYALIALLLMSKFSTGKSLLEQIARTPIGLTYLLVLMIALPPVEELYYRGFLFPALQKSWGSVAAVLVVTVWFGAAHSAQLMQDPIGILIVALAGAIWTVQRLVTASLTVPLISHLTYNSCLIVATIAEIAMK
ncbi:lysostaphin resistance A-like protein [Verrucomicrobiota bacterium]